MTFNPKWIRSPEVVKRDGSNTLTSDWDIGDKRKLILDELRIQDTDGLVISTNTGNTVVHIDDIEGKLTLKYGTGVSEFSTDGTLSSSWKPIGGTVCAVKLYVDNTALTGVGGSVSLLTGDTTAFIIFDSPESGITYRIGTELVNNIDDPVSVYAWTITDKTINGFMVNFSGDMDSDNYDLEWFIIQV